jgi:hypothetical protein
MAEMGVVDYSIIGGLLMVIMSLAEVVRRKIRESTNGDRRRAPTIVNCPNHIEGLAATMGEWSKQSGAQTRALERIAEDVQHNRAGIDRLVDQHAPEGGRETWKVDPRMLSLQEESRDLLKELVTEVQRNNNR